MLTLIPSNPDARGTEWAMLRLADAPVADADPAPLNPAAPMLALRDKLQALAHLRAAQTLLTKRTHVPAAERALDDVDDAVSVLIERVTLAVGVLNAAGAAV